MSAMRTPEHHCPSCNASIDAISDSSNEDKTPKPGDISVCLYCGSFLILLENFKPRLMFLNEIEILDDETRIQLIRIRRAIQRVHSKSP